MIVSFSLCHNESKLNEVATIRGTNEISKRGAINFRTIINVRYETSARENRREERGGEEQTENRRKEKKRVMNNNVIYSVYVSVRGRGRGRWRTTVARINSFVISGSIVLPSVKSCAWN